MSIPMVYADFHNLDDSNRLRLTCAGTREDLARQGIDLREGMVLTFYMDDADDEGRPDDLLAEGVIHLDGRGDWVASIDWSAVRHASVDKMQCANGVHSTDVPPAKDSSLTHPST